MEELLLKFIPVFCLLDIITHHNETELRASDSKIPACQCWRWLRYSLALCPQTSHQLLLSATSEDPAESILALHLCTSICSSWHFLVLSYKSFWLAHLSWAGVWCQLPPVNWNPHSRLLDTALRTLNPRKMAEESQKPRFHMLIRSLLWRVPWASSILKKYAEMKQWYLYEQKKFRLLAALLEAIFQWS